MPKTESDSSVSAATARERRKAKLSRAADIEAIAAIDGLMAEYDARFAQIVEHVDIEWLEIERLKFETREILKQLQAI